MPKMKTNRGAAKRFKKTATGRYKHRRAFRSHILTKMTSKRKRGLRKDCLIAKADTKQLNQLLPNG